MRTVTCAARACSTAAAIARLIGTIEAGAPDENLNSDVTAFRKLLAVAGPIPAQKALLAHWTGDERWKRLRPPLSPLAEADATALAAQVAALPGYTQPAL